MAPNMGTESEGGFFFKAVDHFQSSVHAACVRANVKKLDVYFAYSVSCNPYHLSYCPKKLSRKCFHAHGWRLKSFNTPTPVEA